MPQSALFDHDFTLAELIDKRTAAKLRAALDATLGAEWQVVDAGGLPLLGAPSAAAGHMLKVPLRLDIEQVGNLLASGVPQERILAAARWMEMMLEYERRYRMVASLHIETVSADFATLQRKHAELQVSEQKYRILAAELESRVAEQVDVITRAQRQLYQSEKMASVGSLAAGMAHEINNPIGFIRSNMNSANTYFDQMRQILSAYHTGGRVEAERLWQDAGMDFVLEDFPGLLTESIDGADRIARIVANLMKYAGIDYALSAQIDLNDAIRTVASIVADQVRDGIALELDLQPLPKIECDQGRIHQMLLALMQNAVLAIADRGTVRVSTRLAGREIHIAIRDNGCGIATDSLARIFDPFYTTREVGKGVGLGLTVSADIAAAHGGRITVDSAPGIGSTFTIHLPLAAASAP